MGSERITDIVLYLIDAEIDLCEQRKVLDMSELIDFANVVHADVHKLQALDHFKFTESSRWVVVERELELVVGSVQLDHVLQGAQASQ